MAVVRVTGRTVVWRRACAKSRTRDAGCFRRFALLLARQCWPVRHKRVYRLEAEEKRSWHGKRGRKRVAVRQPLPPAGGTNEVGSGWTEAARDGTCRP